MFRLLNRHNQDLEKTIYEEHQRRESEYKETKSRTTEKIQEQLHLQQKVLRNF